MNEVESIPFLTGKFVCLLLTTSTFYQERKEAGSVKKISHEQTPLNITSVIQLFTTYTFLIFLYSKKKLKSHSEHRGQPSEYYSFTTE